jgi:hypothetical protein
MLPIFDRERTIVDAFRYLGRETALKALKKALTRRRHPFHCVYKILHG